MTAHEDEHERKGQEAEYELSEMEDRSDKLAEKIEETREDWQAKQRDDGVPGAVAGTAGDPDADGPPPEAQEPPGDED